MVTILLLRIRYAVNAMSTETSRVFLDMIRRAGYFYLINTTFGSSELRIFLNILYFQCISNTLILVV
jgi:hypothetical protein